MPDAVLGGSPQVILPSSGAAASLASPRAAAMPSERHVTGPRASSERLSLAASISSFSSLEM